MYPWKAPHISLHCPPIEPLASDDIDTQLVRPGTTSYLALMVLQMVCEYWPVKRESTGLSVEQS